MIKQEQKSIVTVKGFKNEKHFIFYCPFCDKFHKHGAVSPTGKHNTKYGHRGAHCSNDNSPFNENGYMLKEFNKKELKQIKELVEQTLKKYAK